MFLLEKKNIPEKTSNTSIPRIPKYFQLLLHQTNYQFWAHNTHNQISQYPYESQCQFSSQIYNAPTFVI